MRAAKHNFWLTTKAISAFHAVFLLENPKPHKLGCLAGLNITAGIGIVHVITLILLDVSTAMMVKNTQFSILLRWMYQTALCSPVCPVVQMCCTQWVRILC